MIELIELLIKQAGTIGPTGFMLCLIVAFAYYKMYGFFVRLVMLLLDKGLIDIQDLAAVGLMKEIG